MNQRQMNRLAMNKAVLALNLTHAEVWQAMPAFLRAQAALSASIDARESTARIQSLPTTGTTLNKEQASERAIDAVLKLARNTCAYAMDVRNYELLHRLNYSKSYLLYLPDHQQLATLSEMVHQVTRHQEQLWDYGVDVQQLSDAESSVQQLSELISTVRGAIDTRAAAGKSVKEEESAGRHALAVMDHLIHNFAADHPNYVRQYRQARIIVDAGVRHEDKPDADDGLK